jgi:hypothetical protein
MYPIVIWMAFKYITVCLSGAFTDYFLYSPEIK